MRRIVFKVLSIIMALCIFLSLMAIGVSAADNEIYTTEEISITNFSPETKLETSFNNSVNKFYNGGTDVDTTNFFYNQLTENQKKMYNQIWEAGAVEEITFDLTNIKITGRGTTSDNAKNTASTTAQQDIMMALTALNEDNPLFFWVAGFGMSWGGSSTYVSGSYVYTITTLILQIGIDTTHYTDFADAAAKQSAIINKLKEIKVNGISRHEKVKSIHDYIVNNMEYDRTISKPNIFDAYGALVAGLCVCEGYAEAFKLICDREGIPCITVIGNGGGGAHKWNMVQMENGEWFTLDSTWDDQSAIYYSYFLIGSDTKTQNFGYSDVADSTVHIPDGKLFKASNVALSYPTLSKDTYGIGNLRYNAKDIHFDATRNVLMIGQEITSYLNYIEYSGAFSRTANKTGTTGVILTVSDSVTTKEYIVVKRGDVDASNYVTEEDYNKILEISAAKATAEEGSAQYYAADLNQDGAVDTFDAMMLEYYMNGEYSFN